VTYSADDADSGVARVEAKLGAAVVGTIDFTSNVEACPRDSWAACRRSRPGEELSIDTTKAPDGTHALSIRIEDAAGNARVVSGGQVTVDNVRDPIGEVPAGSPAPPDTVVPGGGTPNGGNASPGASLTSLFERTNRASAKTAYGRPKTIRGRLVDPNGRSISQAVITVLTRVPRRRLVESAQVRTDADGRYAYTAPAGPSRLIRLAYRAFSGDSTFADTSDVTLNVSAKARLRVTPGRVRNGKAVTFRGTVLGGYLPSRGVHVDLQVKQGRGWRTFGVARSSRRGAFSLRYRFTRTFQPSAYRFRARVRGEAGVPYEAGVSNAVKVSVR
jgi:hypothetical protein